MLKPVLTGALSVLLLACSTLAASHTLHQAFHSESSAGSHVCVICHFAAGQVGVAGLTSVMAVVVFFCLGLPPLLGVAVLSAVDHQWSASRAPPVIPA